MIVALHVASGAAVGALTGSRLGALLLGPPTHLMGDRIPHQDIASRRFEIASGVACLGLLAARRGPLRSRDARRVRRVRARSRARLPVAQAARRKLFHGRLGWHRSGNFPANVQLLLAGAVVGYLLGRRD